MMIQTNRSSWFVAYISPARETVAARLLRDSGYEVFFPRVPVERKTKRGTNVVQRPLFPRYIFCRIVGPTSHRVIGIPGVIRVLAFNTGLDAVQAREIELLRIAVAKGICRPFAGIAIGTRVRIRSGALAGMEGILLGARGERQLVVSISTIQRSVSLAIEGYDVEPV